ncbi:Sec-independent protein translocase protein TatB [Pannonibacter indicus]|uniref:Sec-independent protein translocase protein TatB n=1 Tax=Pannonibacter indicus TaxID=466044 RepID=A0A0K6HY42_9HYPH|nr:Sec-independent protein translocase protein TatB [Pannonibacter indicus]CUA95746.1 twin arginine-targeting protein translocase TatB [Pannonibacter indicus]
MFDIGWAELMVIACVAIIVVGPKDLPRMLRTFGQIVGKARRMANEFQSTFNDAIREAERQADIDDMRKAADAAANFNPLGDLKKAIEGDRAAGKEAASQAPAADAAAPVSRPVPVSAASSTEEQPLAVPVTGPQPPEPVVELKSEPAPAAPAPPAEAQAAPASQDKTA